MTMATRGPATSATHPTIGPPIGVLPRNTIDWMASTRPRYSGAASTWTMAVDDVMKAMLEQADEDRRPGSAKRQARGRRQGEHGQTEPGGRADELAAGDLVAAGRPQGAERASRG